MAGHNRGSHPTVHNTLFSNSYYTFDDIIIRDFSPAVAEELAPKIVAMDPWVQLDFEAPTMARFFRDEYPCTRRFVVECSDQIVGATSIRFPWLYGPYIELLAILPEAQKNGFGGKILRWIEGEIRGNCDNLWVAVSSFNKEAISFYEKNGFKSVGMLPDLVRAGYTEILLRKNIEELNIV